MKTEEQIRSMLRTIRDMKGFPEEEQIAWLHSLLWVLNELPEFSAKFHTLIAENKFKEAVKFAVKYRTPESMDELEKAVNAV